VGRSKTGGSVLFILNGSFVKLSQPIDQPVRRRLSLFLKAPELFSQEKYPEYFLIELKNPLDDSTDKVLHS
jgi:hypothetical protein